jgi:hypothetical protein
MKMDSKKFGYPGTTRQTASNSMDAYKEFDATELYCPRCKQSVPVRKRLLLVVPEGEKYEYLCAICSTSVGTKMDRQANSISLIV